MDGRRLAQCGKQGERRVDNLRDGQGSEHAFVLVHGAWHGAWCWRRVQARLRAQGRRAFAPTLTGLADRSHLMSAAITLDTHALDIVNLIRWEGLTNVCLVGHSYGGWPISAALERLEGVVTSLVYLDAFVPENGQRGMDVNTPRSRADVEAALAAGAVSRPAPPAASFGVNAADRAWVDAQMTPQPVGVALTPIVLTGARDRIAKKTYMRAARYENARFDDFHTQAQRDPTWRTRVFDCGHDVMLDMPDALADALVEAA
ncbi:MAG: esterase [Hyphomicrobiales bacterium]|nr:esterase [Hyphomicrobiales bacterium]